MSLAGECASKLFRTWIANIVMHSLSVYLGSVCAPEVFPASTWTRRPVTVMHLHGMRHSISSQCKGFSAPVRTCHLLRRMYSPGVLLGIDERGERLATSFWTLCLCAMVYILRVRARCSKCRKFLSTAIRTSKGYPFFPASGIPSVNAIGVLSSVLCRRIDFTAALGALSSAGMVYLSRVERCRRGC